MKFIQTLAKLGKGFSRAICILSLTVAVICAICVLGIAFLPNESFVFSGITIHSLIPDGKSLDAGEYYTALTMYIIICSGEAVLCRIAERFFADELRAGTPFTREISGKMLKLGVLTVALPIITMLIAALICTVMSNSFGTVREYNIGGFGSVGIGILFIILSVVCRCIAERNEENGNDI